MLFLNGETPACLTGKQELEETEGREHNLVAIP